MNTAEKLTILADHLETIPARKIRLEGWACGTVACAVGHACSIPAFKAMGLVLQGSYFQYPVTKNAFGWDAVNEFFGINIADSIFLFQGYADVQLTNPKRHVIKRLRKFVSKLADQVQP